MKLSFIIPFYKGEVFFFNLLSSIRGSYNLSNKSILLELVIVVDSVDSDLDKIKNMTLVLFSDLLNNVNFVFVKNKKNLGVDKSRDIGLDIISGDYFTCIDQDDLVEESYFSVLEKNIFSSVDYFLLNGYLKSLISNKKITMFFYMKPLSLVSIIYNNIVPTPSFLIINSHFAKKKGLHFSLPFDDLKGCDDWFFILQMLQAKSNLSVQVIKDKIVDYCIHQYNYSLHIDKMLEGAMKILTMQKTKNLEIYKVIKRKEKALLFSESLLRYGLFHSVVLYPIPFMNYLYVYCMDYNRFFRFVLKKIIRF